MKTVESWCDLHWHQDEAKVPATREDTELEWDGAPYVIDLCDEHYKTAPDLPLAVLLAAARTAAPKRKISAPPQTREVTQGARGGWVQPAGDEAAAIREWVDAERIMARNEPGRLAYEARSGQGQYYPVWLLKQWVALPAGQRAEWVERGRARLQRRRGAA